MKLLFITIILFVILNLSLSNYCSQDICRRCCQVVPNGCVNANSFNIRGRYTSFLSFCSDCECDDPNFGCGWTAKTYGKVECTSCDDINSMVDAKVSGFAGCGYAPKGGNIVYTNIPSSFS